MPSRNKLAGFTLIEVLLAMTLLSIMVALLFGSLKICSESWNKGETKIAQVNEMAVVYQFFKRHLPSTQPLWDDFSAEERKFSFQGGEDRLQFLSVFPASAERKGLQIFELVFDKADQRLVKVILKPFYPVSDDQQEPEEVILLEHVEKFEISYFGKEKADSEGEWSEQWMERGHLPILVKIKIELENQSFWPEMIFALKLSVVSPEFMLDGK